MPEPDTLWDREDHNWQISQRELRSPRADDIDIDPDIQSGTPCIRGTEEPIASLFTTMRVLLESSGYRRELPSRAWARVERLLEAAQAMLITKAMGVGDSTEDPPGGIADGNGIRPVD